MSRANGPFADTLISCPVAAVPSRVSRSRPFTPALCLLHLWEQHSGMPGFRELVKCGPYPAIRAVTPQLLPDKMDTELLQRLQGMEVELLYKES